MWPHGELPARPAGGVDHGVALLDVDGHRLLHQHVLARLQGGDGRLAVQGVGQADDRQVDPVVVEQFLVGGIAAAAVLRADAVAGLRPGVGDGPHLRRFKGRRRPQVPVGDAARSDDSYPVRSHASNANPVLVRASSSSPGSPLDPGRAAPGSLTMPRLNVPALQRQMMRRNFLFKFQLANQVGISYDRLTAILVGGETEVEEEIVARLCAGLDCEASEILAR